MVSNRQILPSKGHVSHPAEQATQGGAPGRGLPLLRFPLEIQRCIVDHLDAPALVAVSRCCRQLRDVVHDPRLLSRKVIGTKTPLGKLSADRTPGGLLTQLSAQVRQESLWPVPHHRDSHNSLPFEQRENEGMRFFATIRGLYVSIHDRLQHAQSRELFVCDLPVEGEGTCEVAVDLARHLLWTMHGRGAQLWKLPDEPFPRQPRLLSALWSDFYPDRRIFSWPNNGATTLLDTCNERGGDRTLRWFATERLMAGDTSPLQMVQLSMGRQNDFSAAQDAPYLALMRTAMSADDLLLPLFSKERLASLPRLGASKCAQSAADIDHVSVVEFWQTVPPRRLWQRSIPWETALEAPDTDDDRILRQLECIHVSASARLLVINPLPHICLVVPTDLEKHEATRSLLCESMDVEGAKMCRFSPDERFVALGDFRQVELFDLEESGEPLEPFCSRWEQQNVWPPRYAVGFSPDNLLFTNGWDQIDLPRRKDRDDLG